MLGTEHLSAIRIQISSLTIKKVVPQKCQNKL